MIARVRSPRGKRLGRECSAYLTNKHLAGYFWATNVECKSGDFGLLFARGWRHGNPYVTVTESHTNDRCWRLLYETEGDR